MTKGRLEAFSDGVIAILITIMVLDLKVPAGADWGALRPLLPVIGVYALSFTFLGIYWNNHHHTFHVVDRVTGGILWSNLHLLFWLSLVPFVTAWMAFSGVQPVPTAAYGFVLFMDAAAYFLLIRVIVRAHGPHSRLAAAIGRDVKGRISVVLYVVATPLALLVPDLALGLYIAVALLWLVPDRRIERLVE